MTRLGNKLFSTVLALATSASLLAACGGGGSRSALPNVASPSAPDYTGPLADATFKITIPGPKNSAFKRRPSYVSSATSSVSFVINSSSTVSGTATTGTLGTYNSKAWHFFNTGTLPNANCPASGSDFVCTVTMKLPPGSDDVTVTACNITGGCTLSGNPAAVLSQQRQTFTVVAAAANSFSIVLDANVSVMTVNGNGSCQNGPVGTAYGSVGTSPVVFTNTNTDTSGKTIVTPGLPKIEIFDGTTYQAASGSIGSGAGGVTFTIDQANQQFTITPNSSSSSQTINVKEIPPNSNGGSDDLAFAPTKSFTFSTGVAPPLHNFLGVVEQTGVNTGSVNFFNLTTDAGGPNGFATGGAVFTPASLAVTTSTNDGTQKDVDNPVSLAWDNTGDLLVGNGGSSGTGNLACVPVGAIATGANSSTTVTQNIHDPVGLAYEPRAVNGVTGTVAVGNNVTSPVLAEFVLSGNYTASSNNFTGTGLHTGSGTIGQSLINMPSLAAGTFAITAWDGCEVDPAHRTSCSTGVSDVVIFGPTGSTTTMSDTTTYHIDEPWGLTYDSSVNAQLIIANQSAWHPSVSFYNTSGTYQKSITTYFANSQNPFMVAANGAGLFAVAYTTALSSDQIQIYTNATGATAPVALSGPIAYNATTDPACGGNPATYPYGSSAVVTSMIWLSNTRLLVSLETGATSAQGLYIYDTASTTVPSGQYDDQACTALGPMPAQKAFQVTTNRPFATAFKP